MHYRIAEFLLIISAFLIALVIFTKFEKWNITKDLPTQLRQAAKAKAYKVILDTKGEPQLVETK